MPWSAGTYTLPRDMTDDDSAGIPIVASNFDEQFEDIRDGINLTLTKDGQNEPTANLPMGAFRHTNVGSAAAPTDYSRADQAQYNTMSFARATGAGAYSITLTPTASLVDGMRIGLITSARNSAAAPTLQVNAASAREITWTGGSQVFADSLAPGTFIVTYNSSANQFELTNTQIAGQQNAGVVHFADADVMSAGGQARAAVGSSAHSAIITSGSFTGVMTGLVTSTSTLIEYRRHGKFVEVNIGTTQGISNSNGLIITGVPDELFPQGNPSQFFRVVNLGTEEIGRVSPITSSYTFTRVPTSAFATSGTKGVVGMSFTYVTV